MRILVDTNILLSAMWFKDSRVARTLLYVANNHELILYDRNVVEMRDVIKRKTPDITRRLRNNSQQGQDTKRNQ